MRVFNRISTVSSVWLAVAVLMGAARVDAQTISGPWVSVAGGGGWADGSCDCGVERDATIGGSVGVAGGWTVSDRVRLGAEFALWASPLDDVRPLTAYRMYNLMGTVSFAPRSNSGLFVRTGAGVGFVSGPADLYKGATLDRSKGLGGMLGFGYDGRIHQRVTFTQTVRVWGAYVGHLRSGQDVLVSGWKQAVVDVTLGLIFR